LKLTSTNCQLLGGFNEPCIDKDDPLSKLLSKIETTRNRPLPASVRPQSVPSVSTPAHIPPTQSRPPSLPTLPPVRDVIQQTPPIRSIPQPSTSIPHSSLPSKEAVQKTPHVKVVVQKKLPTKEVVQKTEEEIEVITIPPSPPPAKRSRIAHDPTSSRIIDQFIDTSDAINVESIETDNQLFNLFSQTENAENIPPPSVQRPETTIQPSPSIPSNEVVVKTEVKVEEEDLEIIVCLKNY
uniref:Uncharacterized protein n=1 Tax=Panagrolaimus sp. ES5 TaxID=591445 RepID=A0AC34GHY2_9BILA